MFHIIKNFITNIVSLLLVFDLARLCEFNATGMLVIFTALIIAHICYATSVEWYCIEFVDFCGDIRKVRAHTYSGYCHAILDYQKLGCKLYSTKIIHKGDTK